MKNILFLRREGVYLPEISAYMAYLKSAIPTVKGYDSSALEKGISEDDFDVVWKFMGFDRHPRSKSFIVHEYGSLSVGKLPKTKNLIKRLVNTQPDLRVFLNPAVEKGMDFRDQIPSRQRDMGVSEHFFREHPNPNTEFDFVYSGSLNRGKVIYSMLNHFKENMKDSRLLVVGSVPDDIHNHFGSTPNIHFTGRLRYEDVPHAITRARYGLNIMPDIYPFNVQTSTKVLEYCAAGLPIISTDYQWIRDFEQQSGGRFLYCSPDFHSLSLETVNKHSFHVPDVTTYNWDQILLKSRVFDFLSS